MRGCEDALIFIDASIVKAHRAAAGSKKGNWQKVLAAHALLSAMFRIACPAVGCTSKVHAAVGAKGRPFRLENGSAKIRQQIADEGAIAVIPSKSNARTPIPHDKKLYAMRNIVERFFCKMKDMRRLATRFEKKAINFLSMVQLFAIRCWLN